MKFIIYVLLVNFSLFLPRYIFKLPKNWNPFAFLFFNEPLKEKLRRAFFSRSIDPFRISLEYSILAIIIFSFDVSNIWTLGILSLVGVLVFCFNIYLAVFIYVFHRTPVIKSDWIFLKSSLGFYKGYFSLILLGSVLLLVGMFYFIFTLNQFLTTLPINIFYSIGFLTLILFSGLARIKIYLVDRYLYRSVFSVIIYTIKSKQCSIQYDHLINISSSEIENLNQFKNLSLKKKPNIHIISVESYGSVIFNDTEKYNQIRESISDWDEKLQNSGVHIRSSFIEPPVFAVGTWYSYSSLLFGMKIENGIKHDTLFKYMTNFLAYESLFHLSSREGYINYLLHGIKGDFNDVVDLNLLKRNLNYDVLINNTELGYKGQFLGFMHLQESIPDQYTLNKGLDIARENKEPYTLFYCTLNSHWDFHSPIEIVENWEDLNKDSYNFKTTNDSNFDRNEKYTLAIDYSINNLFDTINKRIKDDDIFILYGDHQPTTLTHEKFGKNTQMHILTKNEGFLNEWEKFGFNRGITPQEQKSPLKLEAFYSAFMSCLNKHYGKNVDLDIPFYIDGIQFP